MSERGFLLMAKGKVMRIVQDVPSTWEEALREFISLSRLRAGAMSFSSILGKEHNYLCQSAFENPRPLPIHRIPQRASQWLHAGPVASLKPGRRRKKGRHVFRPALSYFIACCYAYVVSSTAHGDNWEHGSLRR